MLTGAGTPHISVCVCTYKRPKLLMRLLRDLDLQETDQLFTYSIVVADNDPDESAASLVQQFTATSKTTVRYCTQRQQNIALTRNCAVAHSIGEFVAFIDDDEFPTPRWLLTLFELCRSSGADGVLGPVAPHFEDNAPGWVVDGGFYDRPNYPTGLVIDWKKGRTGNVLLKKTLFENDPLPFRPEFLSGEDEDFFRRQIDAGRVFVWCAEALAYETVPPVRWTRRFLLKRALQRGMFSFALLPTGSRSTAVLKSGLAMPAYAAALPVTLLMGQSKFMSCSFKLCYHSGRVLAACGLKPMQDTYVTQ